MPDRVLHLAWRTKDHKNWSQDHGLTWAVRGAHIRRGFEGKVGMYMGIGLWSISSMNIRLRFHVCFEPSILSIYVIYGQYGVNWQFFGML